MLQKLKERRRRRTALKLICLFAANLVFSCVAVGISAFIPVVVASRDELAHTAFGYPFPFITQNLLASGSEDYGGSFPHRFKIHLDILDSDPQIVFSPLHFFLSAGLVFAAIGLACFLIMGMIKKRHSNATTKEGL